MGVAGANRIARRADLPPILMATVEIAVCPFCGHATSEDVTVEKRIGMSVVFCPAEKIRFTYCEWTHRIEVERLESRRA
jgi:transcription elongation factor Elf1